MPMLTVDDLARDLKVRNEDLLRELVTMGFAVEGPDSSLETEDPAALRAQLVTVLPQREVVEQRIKPTVIRRRAKKAPGEVDAAELAHELEMDAEVEAHVAAPRPEEREPRQSEAGARAKAAAKHPLKKTRKAEPARIIGMAPKPEPVEQPELPATAAAKAAPRERAAGAPKADRPVEGEAAAPVEPAEAPHPTPVGEPVSPMPGAPTRDAAQPPEARGQARRELRPAEGPMQSEGADLSEERRDLGERPGRKKKKKERRMQPAQIIGRVDLRKEPPKEAPAPEPVETPPPPPAPPRAQEAAPPPHPARPDAPAEPKTEEEKRLQRRKDKKGPEVREEPVEDDRLRVRKRKEVVLKAELYDDRSRSFRGRGKGKKPKLQRTEITVPKAIKRRIKLPEVVLVGALAHRMSVKSSDVIRQLLAAGVTASVNEVIDFDTATLVAAEFGFEVESTDLSEETLLPAVHVDTEVSLLLRPPVVTVMGHVDHGKTSLLDAIRSTHVTDQEAGGITQHIGAYKVKHERGELVFLDTPGHEAFTAMRARGAQVTDFVVLVVAADDGVMEQTREAVNHARAANVPIIVAVNKMDKPEADKDRVIRELSEFSLIPESWGGDTLYCFVSAKTHQGIEELLDLILLQAEMMELRANPDKLAVATVVEARLDKGKGPVGTVLIREGTLKLGDPFVAGLNFGKVRGMMDHEGRNVETAGPATPVEVQGFANVPEAGEPFVVVDDEKVSRQIAEQRQAKHREQEIAGAAAGALSLEALLARMQEQEAKELNVIIKADVQGSVEALKEALLAIPSQEIKLKVIHGGVGTITESDVMLASASKAICIGFNVRPTPKTTQVAEQERVDIRLYTVIYEAIEDIRKAMEGMLAPIEKETVVGRAEVIQTFGVAKVGMVAGCHVRFGKIERSNQVRLLRDNRVVYQGKIISMKRFKDDIKEALEGYECGIALDNFRDVKVGDVIEAFVIEKESAKLV